MSISKRIKSLFSMKGKTKIVINDIFEVPYNENKAQIISMPKTENESFKIKK